MKINLIAFCLILLSMTSTAQNQVSEATNVSTSGTLNVTVTTSTSNGSYAPNNIIAIWIQDSSNKFVKTMLVYAKARKPHLINWVTATPVGNSTDAITGATQPSHGIRNCSWNGTDLSQLPVADGTYTVKIEMTENNIGTNLATYTFVKGPNAVTLSPVDQACFSNISINWIPTSTGISDLEMSKLYAVYPNPTVSTIYVSGNDIKSLELLTLSGHSLLKSNDQKLNLSAFPKGIYLVKIETEKETFTKRIVKINA
jgi:hypothetical protein